MMRHRSHRSGFSLLELLLATGIFFILLIGLFKVIQDFSERELARASGKYMKTVADAMNGILDNPDYFEALYAAALATGGGYQLIADSTQPAPDNITKNFVVGTTTIQASRFLNAQFRPTSPLRAPIRILLRVADNPAVATDTHGLDVLIVTATPRMDRVVRRAANTAGESGGVIRTYGSKAAAVVQSTFGSWRMTLSGGLQNTLWYTNELPASLDSDTTGSFLAYYFYANGADKTGDYLYRQSTGDVARNTMAGPLSLGGNDIVGADNVAINTPSVFPAGDASIPDDCEGGVLCVEGTAAVKGSASFTGTMTVNGSALVSDTMNAAAMRVQNGLTDAQRQAYGAQGLFVVDGTGGTQDRIDITGNATYLNGATVGTGIIAGSTAGTVVTVPNGGTFQTGTISARRISSSSMTNRSLNAAHQLKAGIVSNTNMTVNGGTAAVIDIYNSTDLYAGSAAVPRSVAVPKLNIGTATISSFGACGSGCGN